MALRFTKESKEKIKEILRRNFDETDNDLKAQGFVKIAREWGFDELADEMQDDLHMDKINKLIHES